MTERNSLFFISGSKKTALVVQTKIMLARETDEFVHADFQGCFDDVKKACPSVILFDVSGHEKEFFDFLNKYRQTPALQSIPIIPVFKEIDEDTLCTAFELGISDFLTLRASDSEFTVRILLAMRQKERESDFENKKNILSQLKILDKKTGIYAKNYTYTIIKAQSKKCTGSFAVIAPDVNTRNKLSPEHLASLIKNNIRISDFIGFSGDFKIYTWFPETEPENVLYILNKIKKLLPAECKISAGVAKTSETDFDRTEEAANKALSRALLKENSFVVARAKEEINDTSVKNPDDYKNFKMFRQDFYKKLEKMISPVFYQTQKIMEEKLFETKIVQEIKDDGCYFELKNEYCSSVFRITCPGYTRININTIHNCGENEYKDKVCMDIEEVNSQKISATLDDFIKTFQCLVNNS